MTTYRQRLVWLVDGEYTTRNRGKSQSVNRTLDRRSKRREHQRITKEAVDSWYADGADDLYEYLNMFDEYEAQEDAFYEEDFTDIDDYEIEYDPAYDTFFDDWPYDDHYEEPAYWGALPVSPEDTRRIEPEDIGRSLGDILEEILQKQQC